MLSALRYVIRIAVRILAVLMTVVILLGVVDVGWVLYSRLMNQPRYILEIGDLLATFGGFLAVLIAIEIFVNIILYLREDVIHVKLVMATALMAVARKIIILDFAEMSAGEAWALAGALLATSVGYWIVHRYTPEVSPPERHL